MTSELIFSVPRVHCGHCRTAITEEVRQVEGVESVNVDLDTKRVLGRW
jgi:copper chaperone CopZ